MNAVGQTAFRYLTIAVAMLSLPAMCLSAFVIFSLWGASLNGLSLFWVVTLLLLAISLPVLCVFGAVQARSDGRGWRAWVWLVSPILPLVALYVIFRIKPGRNVGFPPQSRLSGSSANDPIADIQPMNDRGPWSSKATITGLAGSSGFSRS